MRYPRQSRFVAVTIIQFVAVILCAPAWSQPSPLPGPIWVAPERPPETAPSPAGGSPGACAEADEAQQVVELVNAERLANGGLPPLKRHAALDQAAFGHSFNMAERDFFAHCDPDTGDLPWHRMSDAGYAWNAAAENIAAGYQSPADVMAGWMGSSGHRANLLSATYREIGVGYYLQAGDAAGVRRDGNGDCVVDGSYPYGFYRYWTQNFGRRNGGFPVVIDREAHRTTEAVVSLYLFGSGWAQDMRLRNSGGPWTAWQPFTSAVAWDLAPGDTGVRVVEVELRNGATVLSASDTICFDGEVPEVDILFRDDFEAGGA